MSEAVATSQQGLVEKYQPYPEYKDSGEEWLGDVPTDWRVIKLGFLATKIGSGKTPSGGATVYVDDGITFLRSQNVYDDGLRLDDVVHITPDVDIEMAHSRVKPMDILINITGASIGRTCIVPLGIGSANVNQHVCIIRLNKSEIIRFVSWAVKAQSTKAQIDNAQTGAAREGMNFEQIASLLLSLPPETECEQISDFLDYETARIDRLIAHQQRLIELLKEKRQALISHAVRTRPGEGHIKLAYAINLLTGYPFASSGFKSAKDTHIPLLRGVNVGVDQIKWDDVVYWDSEDCSHLDDYYLECGDIVFGMDRPWISSGARVAEITQHDTPCLLLQRVARIRAKANHFQTYIKLCLSSNEFRNYIEADLTGVSVPHISPDQIKGFLIRNLPYDEQVSVTKEVLQALEKLNAVESAVFNAIELLQERRTALISAAVTGKIDLRGWTPPVEEAAA